MKRLVSLAFVLLFLSAAAYVGAGPRFITVASTTSTYNSGLFGYLHPVFTRETGIGVRVVAKGTGASLRLAKECNADVLVVHAKAREEAFVAEGCGVKRFDLMYNDFVIVGPPNDPAGVKGLKSAPGAFKKIAAAQAAFASRGDNSGTNIKELAIWKRAGITPGGSWYRSLGQSMGATLRVAGETSSYTLTDRGTWLAFKEKMGKRLRLAILNEGDQVLFNQYGIIAVNPERCPHVKRELAQTYVKWMLSKKTQRLIGAYRKFGEVLFHPSAR